MENAITSLPTLALGMIQESGPLPNSLPGVGAAGAEATEGQAAPGTAGPGTGATQPPGLFNPLFMMLALLLVFMVFSSMMSGRRAKKQAAAMLAALKRGDRVLTVGGLIGTVHEIREDSIVLRVDDVSGAKAHFTRGAVQQVLKSARSDTKIEAVAEAG